MKPNAAIVFVTRKHVAHTNIVHQLSTSHSVVEWQIPSQASPPCSITSDVSARVPQLQLIVIYLSNETTNNPCVESIILTANAHGARVVGIWLEDAAANSAPRSFEQLGDGASPYSENLSPAFTGEQQIWQNPTGEPIARRNIKKHTCG
jgi:hypothetical protein